MCCLDIEVEGLVAIPPGTDVFGTFTGRKRYPPAVGDTHRIRCRRCDFTPIVRNVNTGDYRPCARIRCRFAGEVAGVEFGDGGVEVVEVEHDDRHDLTVDVDFGDAQRIA